MPLQNELIIFLIASVMLAMGLSISFSELRAAARSKTFAYVLAINLLALPIIASIAYPLLDSTVANTLLLAAVCGVGTTAPLFTANVRGDIATATLGVVVTGFAALIILPLSLWWFDVCSTGNDVAKQALWLMLLWQVAPLLLGMGFAKLQPSIAPTLAKVLKGLGNASLIVLIIGFAVIKGTEFFQLPAEHLLTLSTFVALTFAVPALITKLAAHQSALVFTTSTRNLNLGLLIVVDVLQDEGLLTYVLVYCAIMYAIWPLATLWLRKASA